MSEQVKKAISLRDKWEKTGLFDPNYINNDEAILIKSQERQLIDEIDEMKCLKSKWENVEFVDSGSLKPRHKIILESEEKKL